MSSRRHNLRRAVRDHHRNTELRAGAVDPGVGEKIAKRYAANLVGYPAEGAVNAYYCPDCKEATVTVHADPGVTPMFLACRVTEGCHGRAVSTGYKLDPDRLPAPTHEWFRPVGLELRKLDSGSQDHVRAGGLMLREIA